MTLVQRAKGKFVFGLSESEKALLAAILDLYPRVTSSQTLASRPGAAQLARETQALLEESLADHRAENKKTLKKFLADPKRFAAHAGGWQLALTKAESDWLLQILNDVRVGSWIILGSPENYLEVLNKKNERDFWAMEIAGRFESVLLEALSGPWHA